MHIYIHTHIHIHIYIDIHIHIHIHIEGGVTMAYSSQELWLTKSPRGRGLGKPRDEASERRPSGVLP